MSFIENILKKIEIVELSEKVIGSISPHGSGQKINRDAMAKLLDYSPYTLIEVRDLKLYKKNIHEEISRILVLDNELPIYNTTVEDVALRRSPTIKEMISIRNAIKILNDKDILVTKKRDSVILIKNESLDLIDLSYNREDLEKLLYESLASLEIGNPDDVLLYIKIYSELLRFQKLPKEFKKENHIILGIVSNGENNKTIYGPFISYDLIFNKLKFINNKFDKNNREEIEFFNQIMSGNRRVSHKNGEVFRYLIKTILEKENL